MPPATYTFARYLSAKETVDDRALNKDVFAALQAALAADLENAPAGAPLRVLELGAGAGAMAARAARWGLWPQSRARHIRYTALDSNPTLLAAARPRLAALPFEAAALEADLLEYAARPETEGCADLLIAHAVLDLLDLPSALPLLARLLRPAGRGWFTINFDGGTLLQPEIDRPFDDLVEQLYHASMDARRTGGRPSGDSRTGRHLFAALPAAGLAVVAAGASDWVVFAGRDGYPADEASFLHFIVHTMHGALGGHPDLPAERFARWISARHAQIERGELVYIAHQIDFAVQRE